MNKIKKGFSLVEVMIVIAIIGVSAGIVLRNMDTSQKTKTELEVEGRKLSAIIESQKNNAMAGKKDAGVGPCEYMIKVTDNNKNSYSVGDCNPVSPVLLPSGMKFVNERKVSFASPSATPSSSSTFPVNFVLEKDSQYYVVSVAGLGALSEKFALVADPIVSLDSPPPPPTPTCSDGAQNGTETGVDCGGSCAACVAPPTCSDGAQNGTETGVDCGGSCTVSGGGITYGTVVAEDGKCWLDRNLGASQIASGSVDWFADGWYFQWGRKADGHQILGNGMSTVQSSTDDVDDPADTGGAVNNGKFINNVPQDWRNPKNDNLWQGVSGINNPCPAGFRVPTQQNWIDIVSAAGIASTADAYNKTVLKLPASGTRLNMSGNLNSHGVTGHYWSSSVFGFQSYDLMFSGAVVVNNLGYQRSSGLSVRCIKD